MSITVCSVKEVLQYRYALRLDRARAGHSKAELGQVPAGGRSGASIGPIYRHRNAPITGMLAVGPERVWLMHSDRG
ncbi:hypothetical protein [Kamptonema formosum]|uniref:hypothetical protein n=1 Tax=Kamptonema formosum TaxID=331992 RepID=UPI0012DCD18E|nr:hypothetical protein [Oscillatoria sp. PCC 10802]